MFINKWLISDSFNNQKYKNEQVGFCLYLAHEPSEISSLYKFMQEQLPEKSFTILLAGDDFHNQKSNDSYLEKIIGLFFQPSYYLYNYQPLLFLKDRTPACSDFITRLLQKSRNQGLQNILILELKNPGDRNNTTSQFTYPVSRNNINYALMINNWLSQYLESRNPAEIHLLVSAAETKFDEIINEILREENALKQTNEYKIASNFYQKQKLIEVYQHELYLKTMSEKDAQLHLSILKEQSVNNLKWYYNEYETLPPWYKRFGHIIKVIMGKRSFRSLFNDKVKKYKD